MNKDSLKAMALIAGVGAAAMVNELYPHPHGVSAPNSKKQRKQRNKKNRLAKASRKKNRR